MTLKELMAAQAKAAKRMKDAHADIGTLQEKAKAEEDEARQNGLQSLIDDKMAEFDAAKAEHDSLATDIARAKAIEEAEATLKTVPDDGHNLNDGSEDDRGKAKSPLVKIIESEGKADHEHIAAWYGFIAGEDLTAEQMNRLQPTDDRHLAAAKKGLAARMPKALAKVMLSTNATGYATDSGTGFLRPDPLVAELLKMPVAMPNLFQLVRRIPAFAGRASWPVLDQTNGGNFAGVAHTWKATEGADKAETEPYFSEFTFATHELSSWTEVSLQAISRSVIDIVAEIQRLMRDAAMFEFSRVILNGSGTNQPTGIVGASGINSVTRQTASQVNWQDLNRLKYALTQGNRTAGGFYTLDDTVEAHLSEKVDSDGRPLIVSSTDSAIGERLAGRRFVSHEHTPALGTAGDIIFGNWQQYGFGVEEDITIARSDHASFKSGRVVFRMIAFVGGKPIQTSAFAQLT